MTTTTVATPGRKTKAEKAYAETVARAGAIKALAEPARLEIVALLRNGPAESVQEIQAGLSQGLTQPTISHHLRVLMVAGIIERSKRGVWAAYALVPARLNEIAAWIKG